jgi:hypothetical protein
MVEIALTGCKSTSAPGKSLVSYKLVKLLYESNKGFMCALINGLHSLMQKHGSGYIISVDLKGAFDSCLHNKGVNLLISK